MNVAREAKALVLETWRGWNDDGAMQWAAAVSFYAALALAPLLVTVLALMGVFFEEQTVQRRLVEVVSQHVGPEVAELTRSIVYDQEGGAFAGAWSALLVLVGATAVFGQLQTALNQIWQVRAEGGLRRMVEQRLLGMLMVLVIGTLFLGALALQAIVTALPDWAPLSRTANLGVSVALFTLLSAAVFQILPDVDIRWRDVWIGAAVTAALLTVGQLALGVYLGRSSVGSSYGAAGSLVAVLVWLYYSAMVFFFGAEFTQVWARRRGRRITPTRGAHRVELRRVPLAPAANGDGDAPPSERKPPSERDDARGDGAADGAAGRAAVGTADGRRQGRSGTADGTADRAAARTADGTAGVSSEDTEREPPHRSVRRPGSRPSSSRG